MKYKVRKVKRAPANPMQNPEHRHEWRFYTERFTGSILGECSCGEFMPNEEINRILNAYDTLKKLAEIGARMSKGIIEQDKCTCCFEHNPECPLFEEKK